MANGVAVIRVVTGATESGAIGKVVGPLLQQCHNVRYRIITRGLSGRQDIEITCRDVTKESRARAPVLARAELQREQWRAARMRQYNGGIPYAL